MVGGPVMAPAAWSATAGQEEMRWRKLDSGVSAVSFGFVATAILVSMFLAVAILRHFSAPRGWAALGRRPHSLEEEGSSYASSAAAPALVRPVAPAWISRRPGNSTAARPLRCLFMPKVSQF